MNSNTIHRRDFHRAAGAALGALCLPAGIAHAQARAPVEGKDFVRLPTPVAVPAGGKIDVIEFFSYGCPHCFDFEPALEAWVKRLPPDVAFRRVAAAFNAPFEHYAKLHYALEQNGLDAALGRRVFAAIHVQRLSLGKDADVIAFVQANGGDGAKVLEAMKSFGVATRVRQSKQMFDAYKVDGVPTLGIHGRWFTSPSLAGGKDQALAVADELIKRARKPA